MAADQMWSSSYLDEIGVTADVVVPAAPAATAAPEPSPKAPAAAAPASAKKEKKEKEKAAPAPPAQPGAPPPAELSPEELAKMSKEERKAYHQARRAAQPAQQADKPAVAQLSKAQRRAMQEAQRKAKEDVKQASVDNEELLKDLKLQGLSEEQAREVMAEIIKEGAAAAAEAEEEDDEDGEPDDLMGSVRRWIREQKSEKITKESIRDFNMKVRFQGHVDSTPPDHLRCILHAVVQEACAGFDLAAPKLQPGAVAKKVQPAVERWAPLLEALFGKIDDVLEGADTVIQGIEAGICAAKADAPEAGLACGLVGSLMAVREIDMIEDEDLLAGCRRATTQGKVMEKFVEFLEDALDDEDDEDSGSD